MGLECSRPTCSEEAVRLMASSVMSARSCDISLSCLSRVVAASENAIVMTRLRAESLQSDGHHETRCFSSSPRSVMTCFCSRHVGFLFSFSPFLTITMLRTLRWASTMQPRTALRLRSPVRRVR